MDFSLVKYYIRYRNVTGIYKNIEISCQFQIIIISITIIKTLYIT